MQDDQKSFYYQYDMASTSYTYGKIGEQVQGRAGIKTSGSSTTVTASVANAGPFDPVSVGDILEIYVGETLSIRKVTAKASGDSITINSAITIGAAGTAAWYFRQFVNGTAATDGWHSCYMYEGKAVKLEYPTVAAGGGIDVSIQVKHFGLSTEPVEIYTVNFPSSGTTPNAAAEVVIPENAAAVRVGVKGNSDFAGTDSFSAYLIGKLRKP